MVDNAGNYIDAYGRDIQHIVSDSGEGDPDDWYEVFPNGSNFSEEGIIVIELRKDNDPVSEVGLGAINDSSEVPQNVSGFERDDFEWSVDDSSPSQIDRYMEGPPSGKITLHDWSIKQPVSESEYQIMKRLIDNPNGVLLIPPSTRYVLDSKVEEDYRFEIPIELRDEGFASYQFKQFCEIGIPEFLSNDPAALQILKNIHAYFVNSHFLAKKIRIGFLNNLERKIQKNSFLEILDDYLDGFNLHQNTVSKVRVCLGHGLYSIELKNRKQVRKKSEEQVNLYERNPNVKKTNYNIT